MHKIITLYAVSYERLMEQKSLMESLGWGCLGKSESGYDESVSEEFFTQTMRFIE